MHCAAPTTAPAAATVPVTAASFERALGTIRAAALAAQEVNSLRQTVGELRRTVQDGETRAQEVQAKLASKSGAYAELFREYQALKTKYQEQAREHAQTKRRLSKSTADLATLTVEHQEHVKILARLQGCISGQADASAGDSRRPGASRKRAAPPNATGATSECKRTKSAVQQGRSTPTTTSPVPQPSTATSDACEGADALRKLQVGQGLGIQATTHDAQLHPRGEIGTLSVHRSPALQPASSRKLSPPRTDPTLPMRLSLSWISQQYIHATHSTGSLVFEYYT